MSNKEHNNIILKLGITLATKNLFTIKEVGKFMQETSADDFTSNGFWLYSYNSNDCYLSDKFLETIGYNRSEIIENVDFFYKVADNEHLKKGFDMLNELIKVKSEACFINYLDYTCKDGIVLNIKCSGTVLYKNNKPYIVLGTHEINEE